MKTGTRIAALAALLMLPLASCDCSDPDFGRSPAEIAISPQQLSWGDVCLDSETTRSFTITNRGRSPLHATLAIEGGAADFFSLDREAVSIETAGGTAQVTVSFNPTGDESLRNTTHTSEVVIESNGSEEPVRLRLSGRVADVDPEPILSFGCSPELPLCGQAAGGPCCLTTCERPDSTDPADVAACNARKLASKILDFGSPVFDEEVATVSARVQNLGCGDLEVSEVRIERLPSDTCDPVAAEGGGDPVEQVGLADFAPFTVKGSVDPLAPNTEDVIFEFRPLKSACNVNRKFVLVTNDPAAAPDEPGAPGTGPAAGTLSGSSSQPLLWISPPGAYGAVPYDGSKELEFLIRNGNVDQDITIQNLEILGRDPSHFEIVSSRKCGEETGTDPTNIFMARSTGSADTCEDRFHVTIRYTPGLEGGRHEARFMVNHAFGTVGHTLSGNSLSAVVGYPTHLSFGAPEPGEGQPRVCSEDGQSCLSGACQLTCTDDDDCGGLRCVGGICDGGTVCAPACGPAERKVEICNEGIAPLTISSLEIQSLDGGPAPRDDYFGEGGPLIFDIDGVCAGETLLPGQCCTDTVSFQDSRVGGNTMALLLVHTDDPQWQEGYPIDLASHTTAAGRIPTAHIEPFGTNPPVRSWVRIDGTGSSVKLGEIGEYRWRIDAQTTSHLNPTSFEVDPKDPSAPCPPSWNGGDCLRLSEGGAVLEFWSNDTPGLLYEISLQVTSNLCDPEEESGVFRRELRLSDPDI